MGRAIFTPIAYPEKYRYVISSDFVWDPMNHPVSRAFRYYETMGDGNTAHTPDMPLQLSMLTDFLFTIAAKAEVDGSTFDLVYDLRPPVSERALEFAYELRHKEDKVRYFSPTELKVSASDTKRHDKRYFQVTARMDGSPLGMYEVLCQEYYTGMQRYALMEQILDWMYRRQNVTTGKTAAETLNWQLSHDEAERLSWAYRTMTDAVAMYEAANRLARSLRNYREELERLKVPAQV